MTIETLTIDLIKRLRQQAGKNNGFVYNTQTKCLACLSCGAEYDREPVKHIPNCETLQTLLDADLFLAGAHTASPELP